LPVILVILAEIEQITYHLPTSSGLGTISNSPTSTTVLQFPNKMT